MYSLPIRDCGHLQYCTAWGRPIRINNKQNKTKQKKHCINRLLKSETPKSNSPNSWIQSEPQQEDNLKEDTSTGLTLYWP